MWSITLFALAAVAYAAPASKFPQLKPRSRFNGVMLPAIHWDHDFDDLKHVIPKAKDRMYYAEKSGLQDPYVKHVFGDISAEFFHPTVLLEYSKHITDFDCNANSLEITMDNKAFNVAQQTWPAMGNMMIATYKPKCGRHWDRRTFWKVASLAFEQTAQGGKVKAVGNEVRMKDTMRHVNLNFGEYDPPKIPRSPYQLEKKWDWDKNFTVADITFDSETQFPAESDSPWGSAYELYHTDGLDGSAALDVYCVGCGVSGSAQFGGQLSYSVGFDWPPAQLHTLLVRGTGQMHVGMGLGLVASYEYSDSWDHDIATIPLDPWSIPDVFTLGPSITLKVGGKFTFNAEGDMLAQVGMDIGPFEMDFDFLDTGNSGGSGFDPSFTQDVQTSDQLSASAELDLPVELGIGIQVPALDFDHELGIVDTPGLELTATYSIENGPSCDSGGGVNWNLNFKNDVDLDIFDADDINLSSYTSPDLLDGCITV